MSSEQAVDEIASDLSRLEQALERETANEKRASLAVFLVTAVIGVVILGFVLANYLHFKSEWTAEKFAGSLQNELEELNPSMMAEIQHLGEQLLPVYAAEGRKQFDRLGPELAQRLAQQLDQIGEDIRKEAHGRLLATQEKVRAQTEQIIFETYPDMKSAEERDKVTRSFEKITEEAVSGAIVDFDKQFSKDVQKLGDCLVKFDVEDKGESTVDLQKRFISLWLRQLDREIQKL